MAEATQSAVNLAIENYFDHDESIGQKVRELESLIDTYEDRLGTYLIKSGDDPVFQKLFREYQDFYLPNIA